MSTTKLLSDMDFEDFTEGFSGRGLSLLENLWNDCVDMSEEALGKVAKVYKSKTDIRRHRLLIAKCQNGDSLTDKNLDELIPQFKRDDFREEKSNRYNQKTKEVEEVIRYFYKFGLTRIDEDKITFQQLEKAKGATKKTYTECMDSLKVLRESQKVYDELFEAPEKFESAERNKIMDAYTTAKKAHTASLEKHGLSREKFDKMGTDVKSYFSGIKDLKKSEIGKLSADVQILQAQTKIVVAVINKKRGTGKINKVIKTGSLNTNEINEEVGELVNVQEVITEGIKAEVTATPEIITPEVTATPEA